MTLEEQTLCTKPVCVETHLEAPQHDLLLHIVHAHVLGAAPSQQEGSISAEGQGGETLP